MELSRQEYPALLATLQPNQAVNVLNDRVKLITTVNTSIADWLQERRKVEEAYVQGLQKLARRPQQDGAAALGIFQTPWQRIVAGTESLAQSHEMLAQKIEADVETPLRQFASKNREMQSMATIQGNLAAIAKEFESAQKKAEKLRDKSGRPDRVANASSSVDDASQQWESQAPYVFEQLQSLDEIRVNFLRDALTQFQTHEVDQVERNRTSAESCLNALLSIETADEIKAFAAKISGATAGTASTGNTLRRRSSAAAGARPQSASLAPPPTPPSRGFEDSSGSRAGASAGQDRLTPIEEKSKKSSFGGIKRIGTVMSRRKSTAPPPPTPEKRKEKSRFPFRRGDSSRSFHEVDSPPPTAGQGLTPVQSQIPDPPRMPRPQYARGEMNGLTSQDSAPDIPRTNGNNATGPPPARNMDQPLPQIPHELSAAPVSPSSSHASPPSMDVMTRAQEEAAAANTESEEALRNLKIRDQPITEDETEAQRAMNDVASQLRMQAQTSGRMPSVRGRRDVRNTVFIPNSVPPVDVRNMPNIGATPAISTAAAATVAGTADLASPIKRAETPGTGVEDRAVSDSTSVHSGHSLAGLVHHPELHEPGLNASIVETVSTSFSEGVVSRSSVVGEIALAYNQTSEFSDQQTDTIRIENFQDLEKVAANPAFVTALVSAKGKELATAEDRAGEYSVALSAIKRPTPTIALKYQLHLDEANLSAYSPVLFTPVWQIQDSQASVMVVYAINPAFSKASATTTLKNVVITVTLDTSQDAGKAISAMMAPTTGASFKKKQSLVVWRFPELTVDAEQKKLLARFITSGSLPKAGSIETKWELPNIIGSRLGVSTLAGEASDPFADESANAGQARSWNNIPCAKKLVSGRYSAS